MISKQIPKSVSQWDCRHLIKNKSEVAISFYCNDQYFQSVICNPKKYIDILSEYQMLIGMDASPFDNMPLVVQQSQIFINLAITYFYGRQGIKIIPNVRVGSDETLNSLKAYPKNTLISIGTNGFIKDKENKLIFASQIKLIVDTLMPSGIIVYGSIPAIIFDYPKKLHIPIYKYDSFIHKRWYKNERYEWFF